MWKQQQQQSHLSGALGRTGRPWTFRRAVTGQIGGGVTGTVSQRQLLWGSHQLLTPFFVPRSRLPECLFFFYKMGENDFNFPDWEIEAEGSVK